MTASGTYAFNPSLGDFVIDAFSMCGVRPAALLQEHMISARMAANLLLSTWSSRGVNLWMVNLQSIPLVKGTATYDIPTNNIVMLDTYIRTLDGSGNPIDRLILPISRTEYASYPNKEQQGFPTTYWQDRLLVGNVTLWPVPDGTQDSLQYYQVIQIDDANLTNGQTINMPVYFTEAFSLGLGYRLAIRWAPERAAGLKELADQAYEIAAEQNIETSDFYVSPILSGYFR